MEETLIMNEEMISSDRGNIAFDIRRTVVTLMRGPYLWKKERPHVWEQMIRYEAEVRTQLANVFLDLVIDEIAGVAFVRQLDTGDLQVPSLLNSYRYRFIDSTVLLQLRELLMYADRHNDRAVVSEEQVRGTLRLFDPACRTDDATLKRRLDAIIKRLIERHILLPLKQARTYEVSPILKHVLDAGELAALRELYEEKIRQKEKANFILDEAELTEDEDDDR